MRRDLFYELSVIGYKFFLDGENIKLRYQKPDAPPESARQLIEELRKYKAEAVNILKMGEDTVALTEKSQPQASVAASWQPEDQSLLDWFMTLYPSTEPFYLEPHRHIVDPKKLFQSLREEVRTGPDGPRARMGTLQSDLWKLKAYLN